MCVCSTSHKKEGREREREGEREGEAWLLCRQHYLGKSLLVCLSAGGERGGANVATAVQ